MSTQERFDDGLFSDFTIEPEGRTEKIIFQPWHNPRKQLVRKEQWVHYIKENHESILTGRKTIKYFSLPGDDLLDIRVLHNEICLPLNIKLKFVGFNDHSSDPVREQNAYLSLAEVRAMSLISDESVYFENNALHIGEYKSLAYTRMKEGGDYDVVNLDFCDSITSKDPLKGSENHYQLLKHIISIQRSRDEPWLMFITTRVGQSHVHANTLRVLKECYEGNLNHACFQKESENYFKIGKIEDVDAALDDNELFSKFICTSISKWLLNFALSLTPQVSIKVLDAMEYTILPEAAYPDMISIAFLFKPHPHGLQDSKGLAPSSKRKQILEEYEIAKNYVYRFHKTTNCDSYLSSDAIKKEEITLESQKLLESARFNITNYRQFFS